MSSSIKNVYEIIKKEAPALLTKTENNNKNLHGLDLPLRMVIVAPSGSGKTNFLVNLIMLMCHGKGTYEKLTICTRDKDESLYNYLATKSSSIEILEGVSSIPKLNVENYPKGSQSLLVLDDLVLSKNLSAVEEIYIRGRKLGVSVIFISQNFYKIPPVIRGNCSYIVILKLSQNRDCRMILSEMGLGISKEQLCQIYDYATAEKFSPLIIDLAAPKASRFKKGFNEAIPVE
jgi:hypothetical protein